MENKKKKTQEDVQKNVNKIYRETIFPSLHPASYDNYLFIFKNHLRRSLPDQEYTSETQNTLALV